MRWEGRDWPVPCYRLGRRIVWGLTAMILAELKWIVGSGSDPILRGHHQPNPYPRTTVPGFRKAHDYP